MGGIYLTDKKDYYLKYMKYIKSDTDALLFAIMLKSIKDHLVSKKFRNKLLEDFDKTGKTNATMCFRNRGVEHEEWYGIAIKITKTTTKPKLAKAR